jgi:dihydroflavonol-4-reductase
MAVRLPHLVYTSSIATLGPAPPGRLADERDVARAAPEDSVYRAVKWEMEQELEGWMSRGLSASIMLAGGCLGPWDLRLGTGGVLVALARGELPWWVDGWASLVDVDDVARAHVEAALQRAHGRFCLSGHDLWVRDLLSMVAARWGGRVPGPPLSPEAARARADAEEQEAAAQRLRVPVPRELVDMALAGQPVSSRRAARELGFAPRPLEETLDRAHAFYVRCRLLRRNECSTASNDART